MEEELIRLEKELDALYEDVEGDVWRYVHAWEKEFNLFVSRNESKYGWCKEEFEKIEGREILKDSFRERIASYKKLFEEIKKRNRN